MNAYIVAIMTIVLLVIIGRAVTVRSGELPTITNETIRNEERLTVFVSSFIKKDFQASTLLNPSNMALFAQGYRPKIGLPYNPEAGGQKFDDLQKYFTRKICLDLKNIKHLNQSNFQNFIDQVGRWADQTLICAGEISGKYDLNVEGPFNFETELAKVPNGAERERFKQCWLNDFVLSTELRMLAWIHEQLFNTPYIMPEKR